jgi:hypothetical protein
MEVKRILFLTFFILLHTKSNAQYKELCAKDWHRALYDGAKINDSTLLCVGENNEAFLLNIHTQEKSYFKQAIAPIAWLAILQYNTDSALVVGDHESQAIFYFKNLSSKIISTSSKKAFYNGVANENKIFIAGGKTNVANGVKAIPNGFVNVEQSNKTHKVKRPFRFFFDSYTFQNKNYTIGYNAFNSKIFEVNNKSIKAFKKYPYLLHRALVDSSKIIFCGTTSYKRKDGLIMDDDKLYVFKDKDVVWDIKRVANNLIGGGSNGILYSKQDGDSAFKLIKTGFQGHFYRIVAITKNSYAAMGQYGRVVLVTIE